MATYAECVMPLPLLVSCVVLLSTALRFLNSLLSSQLSALTFSPSLRPHSLLLCTISPQKTTNTRANALDHTIGAGPPPSAARRGTFFGTYTAEQVESRKERSLTSGDKEDSVEEVLRKIQTHVAEQVQRRLQQKDRGMLAVPSADMGKATARLRDLAGQ